MYADWAKQHGLDARDTGIDLVAQTTTGELGLCTWLGVGNDPRYTPTTTFETFPFPDGLSPTLSAAEYNNQFATNIAIAAHRLNELRENWLNPNEWVDWTRTDEEARAGYPARAIPKLSCDLVLKDRTLTNLYNERPTWQGNAHEQLDAAVATAYGWTDYTEAMSDDEILRRLLILNQEAAKNSRTAHLQESAIRRAVGRHYSGIESSNSPGVRSTSTPLSVVVYVR